MRDFTQDQIEGCLGAWADADYPTLGLFARRYAKLQGYDPAEFALACIHYVDFLKAVDHDAPNLGLD